MSTQWFLRLPIRIKLYAIVLVASALALLLATAASFFIQQQIEQGRFSYVSFANQSYRNTGFQYISYFE